MTREDVLKLFPEATDEQITNLLNQNNSEVATEKNKVKQYKAKAESADELQKKLDELEAGNLSDLEKANKDLESAKNEIAELKRNNAIRDQREKVMETMKVTSEQAKQIVKDDGSIDYDVLGQITSDKENAAAEAKEKEIADNSMNPGGGSADGGGKEKSEAEKVAETIGKDLAGINETAKATVESYM